MERLSVESFLELVEVLELNEDEKREFGYYICEKNPFALNENNYNAMFNMFADWHENYNIFATVKN